MRKIAPPNALAGSSRRWFGPVMRRTMCGVTSPTKPIVPPTDTHTPMSADTAIITVSLTRRTFTPMCRALSSPTAKALSSRAQPKSTLPNTPSAPSSTRTWTYPRPAREPIVQNVMDCTLSGANVMTSERTLETNIE